MPRHAFLLKELVKRDFKGRYAGSVLGFVWSLIQPLWLLLLFSFVFATVMKVSPAGARTDSFGVFLFAGLVPWMAMHEGVLRGSTAITDNAELVKKLRFPSQILVLAVALAALLHEAIALGLFVVVLAVLGELSPLTLPLLGIAVPLQLALTLGWGCCSTRSTCSSATPPRCSGWCSTPGSTSPRSSTRWAGFPRASGGGSSSTR
jgi:ABC-type polysaccharide/polyol phosphate export permease